MKKFDIILIGAGPASCAAAIFAALNGLQVCLIEREQFPRMRPGETLHPGIEPLLKQLGVLDPVEHAGFIRHPGIWVHWDEPSPVFKPYQSNSNNSEQWQGYQAYREVFDEILLERASALGVTVLMPCTVTDILFDGTTKRINGVIANGKPLMASYVIDGSGGWHWMARQLKLPLRYFSKKLFVRYGYSEGILSEEKAIPWLIADSQGWTWTALVDKNIYQWTRLSFTGKPVAADWQPPHFQSLISHCSKGADVTWRMVDKLAGEGYFITGDAAVILDPASSHGVLRALMSGIKAADLIVNIKQGLCEEEVAVLEYERWLSEWVSYDIQNLHAMYMKISQNLWHDKAEE